MNFTQVFHLTTADGSKRSFSIDQICVNHYEVSLCDSIYSGKAPVFETPQDSFLFMLKIMSWIPNPIVEIKSSCDFLSKEKIAELASLEEGKIVCF